MSFIKEIYSRVMADMCRKSTRCPQEDPLKGADGEKACVAQYELKHWSDQLVWQLSCGCGASSHLSSRSTPRFPWIKHIVNFWWKRELSVDTDAQTHVRNQMTRVHKVVLLKGSHSKQKTEVAGKKKSCMTTWQHSPLHKEYVLINTS